MTVQELIDELQKVEDKDKPVKYVSNRYFGDKSELTAKDLEDWSQDYAYYLELKIEQI